MQKVSLRKFFQIVENTLKIEIQRNESFRNHTTFRIGGKIAGYVEVKDEVTLLKLLELVRNYNVKYFILGGGSNILAHDSKFLGLVIKIGIDSVKIRGEKITCGAGVSLFTLNKLAWQNDLSGLEWSYGIPASVGGAVKMNAGAYGGDMSGIVECVYCTDGKRIYKKSGKALKFSYRHSVFCDVGLIILRVVMRFSRDEGGKIEERCLENLKKKRLSQPYSLASAGSVFKKPENTYAPILIERVNLKGTRCGGAVISKKHCGFIVNESGTATFRQVFSLICKIKKTVSKKFGIMLENEIEIV